MTPTKGQVTIFRLARIVVAPLALLLTSVAVAQSPQLAARTPVTVHGIAYDSLHRVPLTGAFIGISGTSRSTISDSIGHFVFDSIVPGIYLFQMQHDVLDSIGVSVTAARAEVSTGRDTVRISVPSFAAIWAASCHTPTPPKDTGLLVGMVRGSGGLEVGPAAAVSASWLDMRYDQTKSVTQRRWRFNVRSDSSGGYIMCGVPTTTGIRIFAATDSAATGLIDLLPLDNSRVLRLDLQLGPTIDTSARGLVTGVVTGDAGNALPNARVVADGVREVRTGTDGRFILREVPLGTQQIEVRAIGLAPTIATVNVQPRDTARVNVQLFKVTVLDSMRIIATSVRQLIVAGYEERKRSGWGQYRDSSFIIKHGTLMSVFAEMPSVTISSTANGPLIYLPGRPGNPPCLADLWIDRVKTGQDDLAMFRPEDIAAVEVYRRASEVPPEFLGGFQTSGEMANTRCGAVIMWTKRIWP